MDLVEEVDLLKIWKHSLVRVKHRRKREHERGKTKHNLNRTLIR